MTKFDAYHKMKELLTNYYIEAKTTKVKPIAWITSGAPVEFVYAMDVLPVYPENYEWSAETAKIARPGPGSAQAPC